MAPPAKFDALKHGTLVAKHLKTIRLPLEWRIMACPGMVHKGSPYRARGGQQGFGLCLTDLGPNCWELADCAARGCFACLLPLRRWCRLGLGFDSLGLGLEVLLK
eukprot:11798515-Alexandrium_andersonii.AAC.1